MQSLLNREEQRYRAAMIELDDLWTDEEWADLPDDDIDAFARLVNIARPRFRSRLEQYENDEQRTSLQHAYMTHLMGVAQERKVFPFVNHEMPYLRNFNDDHIGDFEADLNLFLAKARARAAKRVAEGMVNLTTREAGVIRLHLNALRQKLDDTPMEGWRKKRLMAKLAEFEAELVKGRVDLGKVSMLAATLISLPGGVYGTLQAMGIDFQKDIVAPIVEARCVAEKDEWTRKVLLQPERKALAAPRSLAALPSASSRPKRGS